MGKGLGDLIAEIHAIIEKDVDYDMSTLISTLSTLPEPETDFDRHIRHVLVDVAIENYMKGLPQRLNQTVSDNGHARTLQNKTNDGGSDGGL